MNYTQDYNQILDNAEEIALKYGLNYCGTEHVLHAILSLRLSKPCRILEKFCVTKETYNPHFNIAVKNIKREGGYTPILKSALTNANKIALDLGLNYVSAEHLLIAILYIDDSTAVSILRKMGVNIDEIKKYAVSQVTQYMKKTSTDLDEQVNVQNNDNRDCLADEYKQFFENNFIDDEPQILQKEKEDKIDLSPLDGLGYDLTGKAKQGRIDPVIGRDEETERIIQVLSRKTKNNPVLVGEAGVGKSAVVEGLALRISKGEVPEILRDKIVFSLDIGGMLAGTRYRGDFEEKVKRAIDYALSNNRIIFFIDEIHNLIGSGSSKDGGMDAAEMLKPLLSRGEVSIIGATTSREYSKYIENNQALERRFQPIYIEQPKIDDAIEILKGLKSTYEAHHKVRILDDAIIAAVKLSDRYIQDRFLPDKAIDLIDEAAAQKRLYVTTTPSSVLALEKKIEKLKTAQDYALHNNNLPAASEASIERKKVEEELRKVKDSIYDERSGSDITVDVDDIKKLISSWTKIPVTDLTDDEKTRLLNLESRIKQRIIGQDEACEVVVRAIKRSSAKLKDPRKPIGSFIFAGPTGVGKTELSKVIAETVFNNRDCLISFDLSEYSDKSSVNKLIGVAPGYVGYGEEGLLTEKVRRHPYSVVVFDEIEKASPEIYDLLLQVLDEGKLTDSKGREVSFKNTIIILTTNVGFSNRDTRTSFGFGDIEDLQREHAIDDLKNKFRPEFINRLDEVVIFNKLSREKCAEIVKIFLEELKSRFLEQNISVEFENSIIDLILDKGYSDYYGARPIKRTIDKIIGDMFADEIILGNINPNSSVIVFAEDGKVNYKNK